MMMQNNPSSAPPLAEESHQEEEEFVNDNPFGRFMKTYLDKFGVREGKGIVFGPIPVDIDESKRLVEADAKKLRQAAKRDLINISWEERDRRNKAGNLMFVVTALSVAWATLFVDKGDFTGHLIRFGATVVPSFLAVGYKLSARTGL